MDEEGDLTAIRAILEIAMNAAHMCGHLALASKHAGVLTDEQRAALAHHLRMIATAVDDCGNETKAADFWAAATLMLQQ